MAITDKNRKSTRYFNLKKRGSHHFDLEKEEEIPVISPKPTEIPRPTDAESKDKVAPVTVTPPKENQIPQPKPQSKSEIKKVGGRPGKQGAKQPVAPMVADTTEETGKEGGGSNKWMWIIGAILVVAIIAWLCVRGCSSSNDNVATTEPSIEAVEAAGTSEEEAVVEESSKDGEGEELASSDVETENPTMEVVSSAEAMSSIATPSETAESTDATTPASSPTNATSKTASRPSANTFSAASSASATETSSDIEAEALKVIRGDYGTGLDRKLKLGSRYRDIQNRVNELKRQGAF